MNASLHNLYKVMCVLCPVMAETTVTSVREKSFSKLHPVHPGEFKKFLGN